MKIKQLSLTTKYVLAVCTMLLVVNVILGVLLMNQSGSAMENLIRRHMLSVAETAAALVDADALAALTADDVGSESFQQISQTLTKVKNAQFDTDIKFIYLVRRVGTHYVYTVDPDPVDPADFGTEVVDTPSQDAAWFGEAAVDPEPIEDEWGCYYTAWSSVKDSAGSVVGMVGVDFAADWYDQQMARHRVTVAIVSGLSVLLSLSIMTLMTWQLQRRFRHLDKELSTLSASVESLAQTVRRTPEQKEAPGETRAGDSDSDIVRALGEKIHSTQRLLADYMEYVQQQAYTDNMTHVGNRDAYLAKIKELNRRIDAGTAAFAIAVFDVNGLKRTNDNYGHACGDRIIIDASDMISEVFGREQTYRFGGDEFVAVAEGADEHALEAAFKRLDAAVEHFNQDEKCYAMPLSFSHGGAVYRPGEDAAYKEVFKRADEAMYRNKGDYYRTHEFREPNYHAGYYPKEE